LAVSTSVANRSAAARRFLNPESISQLFDRIVKRSGLQRVRFHDLRHTHASLLVADGTAIKVVAERSVTPTRRSRCTRTRTCSRA
jgi:integrase